MTMEKKTFLLRICKERLEKLKNIAVKENRSLNKEIEHVLSEYIDKMNDKEIAP